MKENFSKILEYLGEDLHRAGLEKTPERAAKTFKFLTQGYSQNLDDIVKDSITSCNDASMVETKNLGIYSLCEEHMLPFIGKCHVAYIPTGKVLGLSKVARIVEMYARRLQIQENLTKQIAEAIGEVTSASGVSVIIEAQHMCMMMRGVEKQNSLMKTSVMLGVFREDQSTRMEFLSLL